MMNRNSLQAFMDDFLAAGGPEKEFVLRKLRSYLDKSVSINVV
jgi:hypothetical protein